MEKLGIDGRLLLAQLVNFGLFLFIFYKFMAKPFRRFIEDEKTREEEKEKIFAKATQKENELKILEEEIRNKTRLEKEKVIASAKKEAELVKQQILEDAHKEAKGYLEKAKKQIEAEKQTVYAQAKEKVVELALFIVTKTLKDVLTEDMQKKATQLILKNAPKDIAQV